MKRPPSLAAADFLNVCRGFLMGGADIIPGVSGGTVALILGVYERLVTAISHVDSHLVRLLRRRRWLDAAVHLDLRFLVALATGIFSGIAGLATVMTYLIDHHPQPTLAVFFGLILASSLLVGRMVGQWSPLRAILATVGAALAFWLVGRPIAEGFAGNGYLFVCGVVAICAMILPGVSGAFILLIMGKYFHVTGIITELVHGKATVESVLALAVFGCGCAVGLLTFSKILRWLLNFHHAPTMAILCGFMIGSLRRLWPFKDLPPDQAIIDFKHQQYDNIPPSQFDGSFWLVVVLTAAAVGFVLMLDRVSRSSRRNPPRKSDG